MNEDELDHDGPTIYDLQIEVKASRELAKKAEAEAKALKQQLADEQSQHAQQLEDEKSKHAAQPPRWQRWLQGARDDGSRDDKRRVAELEAEVAALKKQLAQERALRTRFEATVGEDATGAEAPGFFQRILCLPAPAPPKPAEIPTAAPAPKVPRVILGPEDVTAEMRAGSSCAYGGWRDDYEPIEHAAGRLHDNDELIATLDAIDEPNLVKDFEIPKFDSDERPPPSDLELMEMRYKDDDLLEQLEEKALRDLDVRTFEPPKLEEFLFRTGPLPGDDGPGAVMFDAELCDPEMLPRPGAA